MVEFKDVQEKVLAVQYWSHENVVKLAQELIVDNAELREQLAALQADWRRLVKESVK